MSMPVPVPTAKTVAVGTRRGNSPIFTTTFDALVAVFV